MRTRVLGNALWPPLECNKAKMETQLRAAFVHTASEEYDIPEFFMPPRCICICTK